MLVAVTDALHDLEDLYSDAKACARLVGLQYVEDTAQGYSRQKHGKGFRYLDNRRHPLTDKALRARIAGLVIPPAWQEVWICPDAHGHILATGIDDKGRKQYIYHPSWRTMRDLIKFYRMIVFGHALPRIRTDIDQALTARNLSRRKVLGTMLWLLDNTYIRIGNEQYYQANHSIGLTTLTDKNVVVAGSVVTLSFKAKSGKEQQISFDDKRIATVLARLQGQTGSRLFRYHDAAGFHDIESEDINTHLQTLSGTHISAKDFRTWGGTLMAFNHLIETEQLAASRTPKPEKVVVQAVDAAANVLGNTRSVARASYIHPHILTAYGTKDFPRYYARALKARKPAGLDAREAQLLSFLEQLFTSEFKLLRSHNRRQTPQT